MPKDKAADIKAIDALLRKAEKDGDRLFTSEEQAEYVALTKGAELDPVMQKRAARKMPLPGKTAKPTKEEVTDPITTTTKNQKNDKRTTKRAKRG